MLNVTHPDGHVAVGSHSHGWMCGQMARAWGNGRFGELEPREEVCLAAEQHDVGMAGYDLEPELDAESGLPADVMTMELGPHLEYQIEGPRLLSAQSRYAALISSIKHCSMYTRPPEDPNDPKGKLVASFLERSAELQGRLRRTLDADDAGIERNWRLVRAFDAISHTILTNRAPTELRDVPAAGAERVELKLDRRGDAHTLDPWPFAGDRVVARCEGRLLREKARDRDSLLAALAEAEWVTLDYELVPA